MLLISDKTFKTKSEAKDYIRDIIKKSCLFDLIDEDHKHFDFFVELINRHPNFEEKIGSGIKSFYFYLDNYYKKVLGITRIDGSDVSVSRNKCICK